MVGGGENNQNQLDFGFWGFWLVGGERGGTSGGGGYLE